MYNPKHLMGIGRVSLIHCTTVDRTLGTLGTPNAKEGHSRQRSLQIVDLGTHLAGDGTMGGKE